jgi:hypothetical protein
MLRNRACFATEFQLVDRSNWNVVHELSQRFDTLDDARVAIELYDPCDCRPTKNGDAANPDVRRKLSMHYRSQRAFWDREINGLFAGVF